MQDKIGERSPASQTLLTKDLSENVDLLKCFEDNHDLVESWKVMDDMGAAVSEELKIDPVFLQLFNIVVSVRTETTFFRKQNIIIPILNITIFYSL